MSQIEKRFVATVWDFYRTQGRHDLPWRQTTDPYCVLVSELMLQQTQVARVTPKYETFLAQYPTVDTLSRASLGDVLRLWQGLGYNRRAKFLLQYAQVIVDQHAGVFPSNYDRLLALPGIGPYTAAAICAFAYNQPVELIETNVRQVYIHHFFMNAAQVTDQEILHLVARTTPAGRSRDWYAALMDYGSHLKATYGNNTSKRKGYTKQSTFKGSDREVRGAILRTLTDGSVLSDALFIQLTQFERSRVSTQLNALIVEGLVVGKEGRLELP
jgi:A/G-specific adenine glycosylase